MYSAVKYHGQRLYRLARQGKTVMRQARDIFVRRIELLDQRETQITLSVTCSKGTYIRALARDLAVALDTVGHLSALTRTRVGPFCLDRALTLEAIAERGVGESLLSPSEAVPGAPSFHAEQQQTTSLLNGQSFAVPEDLRADAIWVYDPDGRLVCLASADGEYLRPRIAL